MVLEMDREVELQQEDPLREEGQGEILEPKSTRRSGA